MQLACCSNHSECESSIFVFVYFFFSLQNNKKNRCCKFHHFSRIEYLPYLKSISMNSETFSVTLFCKLEKKNGKKEHKMNTIRKNKINIILELSCYDKKFFFFVQIKIVSRPKIKEKR